MAELALALLLLPPFAASLINGASLYFGDRWLQPAQVTTLTLAATGLAVFGAVLALTQVIADATPKVVSLGTWFPLGPTEAAFSFQIDRLSSLMAMLITSFGLVIARFSVNYMHNEEGHTRYFSVYALFISTMLVLVLADNLVLMFLGWEGVGLCSYLLIGHYNRRTSAMRAATEAFIINRVGDAALIFAIVVLATQAGTVRFAELGSVQVERWVWVAAAAGLLIAAMGKSAQVPLGGWLGKAMEGPTPTSALIHAATMVTAGVYLIVRAHPVFEAAPAVLLTVALVGGITALYGALAGQTASDIKGVLASSTSMHLGLMFVACGLGAYAVAIFYVLAHAFYKAYQFLTAPSILHHLHDKLDPAAKPRPQPLASGVVLSLVLATGMALVPPLMTFSGAPLMRSVDFWLTLGAGILAAALLIYLAVQALSHDDDTGHHADHVHSEDDHAHDTQPGLGQAGGAVVAVLIAAAVGLALQVLPGGADGSWFARFLGMGSAEAIAAAPGVGVTVALLLALLAVHATMSALYLSRFVPEKALSGERAVPRLYAMALNRFWLDVTLQRHVVSSIEALGQRLQRWDTAYTRGVETLGEQLTRLGAGAVGWFDAVPRRLIEGLPGLMGEHAGEAARRMESAATEGVESSIGRTVRAAAGLSLKIERLLSQPAFAVVLVLAVVLIVMFGV